MEDKLQHTLQTDQHHDNNGHDNNNNETTTTSSQSAPATTMKQKLGVLTLAAFAFSSTSAGPFGIEDTVRSAGPLLTLLCVFLTPVFIISPICLMMEELGGMMPSNHGSIRWVTRALGLKWGFANAYYQQMMNLVDVSIYCTLSENYLQKRFYPTRDEFYERYLVKLAFILVFGVVNFFNIKEVGLVSAIITVLIISPFLVGFVVGVDKHGIDTASWREGPHDHHLAVSSLLSAAMWNFSGFLANGSIVGECQPGALFKGQLIALLTGVILYFLPLAVTLNLETDWSKWHDGYLSDLFERLMPGLGDAVSVAGAVSGVGLYISSVTTYARTMWGVADLGWLPQVLTSTNRHGVPHINVAILIAVCIILNLFHFSWLVRLEFVFASMTYLFLCISFIALRFNEPDAYRRWSVPPASCPFIAIVLIPLPLFVLNSALLGSDFESMTLLIAFFGATALAFPLFWFVEKNKTPEIVQRQIALTMPEEQNIVEEEQEEDS